MPNVTLTNNRIVVLRALQNGPRKWSELRKEYFGEDRAKQQASTSFYMQVKAMTDKGLVTKTALGYESTPAGKEALQAVVDSGVDISTIKTAAQIAFEASGKAAASIKTGAGVEVEA
jgi:DNA-binding HxlR family transcriptional regulator